MIKVDREKTVYQSQKEGVIKTLMQIHSDLLNNDPLDQWVKQREKLVDAVAELENMEEETPVKFHQVGVSPFDGKTPTYGPKEDVVIASSTAGPGEYDVIEPPAEVPQVITEEMAAAGLEKVFGKPEEEGS